MKEIIKHYKNEDITVEWKPSQCIHSAICFRGLINVFNPSKRPWITLEGGTTEEIIAQIKKCPSGALSYTYNAKATTESEPRQSEPASIEILENGPIKLEGAFSISGQGIGVQDSNKLFLCRCGQSSNKPFCDGAHRKAGFQG